MAAESANAAPAPSTSRAAPYVRARRRSRPRQTRRSLPSKGCRRTERIPRRSPGRSWTSRSADIARPGRSCRRRRCWRRPPSRADDDIDAAMNGNLCRCGTYIRIRKAVHRAAEIARERNAIAAIHGRRKREGIRRLYENDEHQSSLLSARHRFERRRPAGGPVFETCVRRNSAAAGAVAGRRIRR